MYDYEKYKRVFAFGCSFTEYKYPTWADIMSKNIPQAEFYNLGRCGGGNVFIGNRITEANRVFNFCETDLVMVMWTTFCREDRYLPEGGWSTPGNIYSQGELPFADKEYLLKYADPLTFLVRDLSIIDMATTFLNSLPCDTLNMLSVPFDHQMDNYNEKVRYFINLYKDLEDSLPDNLFDLEMNGYWQHGSRYKETWTDLYEDYHPSPLRYANYLKKIGIELTDEAYQYAIDSTIKLQAITHYKEFETVFPKQQSNIISCPLMN